MTKISTDPMPLESLDTDGALRETADAMPDDGDGATRSELLRKAGVAGGGLIAGGALLGALPELAAAHNRHGHHDPHHHRHGHGHGHKRYPRSDVAILNFALTLEYLEAAFYREAVDGGALSGATLSFAQLVADHEATHVTALKQLLGRKAVKSPTFDFQGTTMDQGRFQSTAFVLENTGVQAYLGQAGNIKTPSLLGAAASIVTIEARHAAGIAEIIKGDPKGADGITPNGAFDVPLSKAEILKAVKATGFITG